MKTPQTPETKNTSAATLVRGLPSESIVALVLLSINAHYERNADQIEKMLQELKAMGELR